jgi:uncharacterized membrane protein YkoI
LPGHTIDQVLERFEANHRNATVTGIDHAGWAGRWNVYFTRARRGHEVRVSDRDLAISAPKAAPRAPASRLTFRQALARVRHLQPGTVLSLELERDEEKGPVWSAVIAHERRRVEVYISPSNGRLIEREVSRG